MSRELPVTDRPRDRGTLVLWGLLGAYPFGGITWQVLQHLEGLRRLGFDVWYVEDHEDYVLDPVAFEPTPEVEANVAYLRRQLERIGMGDRWIFRVPQQGTTLGREPDELARLYERADAVLNLGGAQHVRADHYAICCLLYLETDPVQRQVEVALGDEERIAQLARHDHLFTYGTNLGAPDCLVPLERFTWVPTRPPAVRDWWDGDGRPPARDALTTVLNWQHSGKDVTWDGQTWTWRKDLAFAPYLDLPARSPLPLEMAVGAISAESVDDLRRRGWRYVHPATVADPMDYRDYVRAGLGEFTAAKEQYVRPRSGWFSDRSVCYLAAGRPVVTEETGISNTVPSGDGLLCFGDADEALAALERVAGDYPGHAEAARELAREYFDAERLLGEMLERAGVG